MQQTIGTRPGPMVRINGDSSPNEVKLQDSEIAEKTFSLLDNGMGGLLDAINDAFR